MKKFITTTKKVILDLACDLGMLDLNSSVYTNILTKRHNVIRNLDKKLVSCGESLKDYQSQLMTLKPTDKTFKKSFVSLQESLISLQAYIEKASKVKSKLEGSLESLYIKASNSNKFLIYSWGTRDRSSGERSGKHLKAAIRLHQVLLSLANVVDYDVEEDLFKEWQELPEQEKAWAFGTTFEYHCAQKSSDLRLQEQFNETADGVYQKYAVSFKDLLVKFNSYNKPTKE